MIHCTVLDVQLIFLVNSWLHHSVLYQATSVINRNLRCGVEDEI